jgi:peptidase A4-like protein
MRVLLKARQLRRMGVAVAAMACVLLPAAGTAAASTANLVHGRPAKLLTGIGRATTSSTNWSGYATYGNGTNFTSVKGRWVQPAASCPTNKAQYSSFWVGIDGYDSSSVEQIGTDADCIGTNRPSYYAWYEMYPAFPVNLSMKVSPGDTMAGSVTISGSTFTLTIKDVTTGQSFTTKQSQIGLALGSAEWVAEAPSSCNSHSCKVLPLANFGKVKFSGSYTTGDGHTGSISDPAWSNDKIVMVTSGGGVKAQPSALNSAGTAFSVNWVSN